MFSVYMKLTITNSKCKCKYWIEIKLTNDIVQLIILSMTRQVVATIVHGIQVSSANRYAVNCTVRVPWSMVKD